AIGRWRADVPAGIFFVFFDTSLAPRWTRNSTFVAKSRYTDTATYLCFLSFFSCSVWRGFSRSTAAFVPPATATMWIERFATIVGLPSVSAAIQEAGYGT